MASIVVSLRLQPEEIAKALDGLLNKNHKPAELTTISSIIRTTFYHGIIATSNDPKAFASRESMEKVHQLLSKNKQVKQNKNTTIKSLLNT